MLVYIYIHESRNFCYKMGGYLCKLSSRAMKAALSLRRPTESRLTTVVLDRASRTRYPVNLVSLPSLRLRVVFAYSHALLNIVRKQIYVDSRLVFRILYFFHVQLLDNLFAHGNE